MLSDLTLKASLDYAPMNTKVFTYQNCSAIFLKKLLVGFQQDRLILEP